MISILLAVYNGEKYLKYCIDSVLNQTYTEWELLIGFNGTTDNSKNIVSNYKDSRIRVFDYNKDKGKAKTLNKLIKESKYDWLAMQDDDDVWLSNKIEKQLESIDYYDVIGTYIKYIDTHNTIIGGPTLAERHDDIKSLSLNGINQIANSSAIFSKDAVLSVGGWREDIDGIEDYDLWKRLISSGFNFYNVPEYLTFHRIHQDSNFNAKGLP